MKKTELIELENGNVLEIYEILCKTGAKTGDLIYDKLETKFHPVMRLGNTNWALSEEFQNRIHKVIHSSVEKHNKPFPKNWQKYLKDLNK